MLTWNPSLYGGKQAIPLPKGRFWKPDIAITNTPANTDASLDSNGFAPAWATFQGLVVMLPAGSFSTTCQVDTTLYPFDKHDCIFHFVVANEDISELKLVYPERDIDTNNFIEHGENGEWIIETTSATNRQWQDKNLIIDIAIPAVQTSISLRRRPAFEIINKHTPFIFMTILNILTCVVPPNSGERLSFAVTLYLALVFATTALIDRIPNNSLKMPLMSYKILSLTFINTAGVIWSICIVHLATVPSYRLRVPSKVMQYVMRHKQRKHNSTCKTCASNKVNPIVGSDLVVGSNIDVNIDNRAGEKQDSTCRNAAGDLTGLDVATFLDKCYVIIAFVVFIVLESVSIALMLSQ